MRIEADRRLKGPQEAKQSFRESSKPEAPSGICFLQKLPDMGTPIRRAPHLPWVPSGYLASFSFVFLKVHWDWMCRCGPNFTSDHKNESFFFPNGREGNRFLRGFLITSVYWIPNANSPQGRTVLETKENPERITRLLMSYIWCPRHRWPVS